MFGAAYKSDMLDEPMTKVDKEEHEHLTVQES